MPVDPELAHLKGRYAMARRWHPNDHEAIAEARAELERANVRKLLERTTLFRDEVMEIANEVLPE